MASAVRNCLLEVGECQSNVHKWKFFVCHKISTSICYNFYKEELAKCDVSKVVTVITNKYNRNRKTKTYVKICGLTEILLVSGLVQTRLMQNSNVGSRS